MISVALAMVCCVGIGAAVLYALISRMFDMLMDLYEIRNED